MGPHHLLIAIGADLRAGWLGCARNDQEIPQSHCRPIFAHSEFCKCLFKFQGNKIIEQDAAAVLHFVKLPWLIYRELPRPYC
eukprot:1139831-Pelagomonas_calceolata.AAC.1